MYIISDILGIERLKYPINFQLPFRLCSHKLLIFPTALL